MTMNSKEESVLQDSSAESATEAADSLSDKDEVYRVYSALSFVFLLIVIGLPLWWKTTTVHREPLPYTQIAALKEVDIHFRVDVVIAALDKSRGEILAFNLEKLFKTSNLFHMNFTVVESDKAALATVKDIKRLELAQFSRLKPGVILLLEVPGLIRFTPDQVLVGRRRNIYFSVDTGALRLHGVLQQWILREHTLIQAKHSLSSGIAERDPEGRYRLPPAKGYNLLVTAVNPDPESLNTSNWDLHQAIDDYLFPFLDHLSPIAQFFVRSQWLYLTPLEIRPRRLPQGGYGLDFESLPQLITPLEKKLATHVSSDPCIQLLVYVPPCSEAPLLLLPPTHETNKKPPAVSGFHSARWGGLAVQNPPLDGCSNTLPVQVDPDWPRLAAIWLQQLRSLIGLPEYEALPRASMLPEPQHAVRLWEVDALMRIRTLEQLLSARLTLQSLSALLEEIGNIVIGEEVAEAVVKAVEGLQQSAELLAQGNLTRGLAAAREAFLHSEAAFTDQSLLSLLYFPDDQKYAVYIPLFLPVMIPVVMSLKNVKNWIAVLRTRKQKVD